MSTEDFLVSMGTTNAVFPTLLFTVIDQLFTFYTSIKDNTDSDCRIMRRIDEIGTLYRG